MPSAGAVTSSLTPSRSRSVVPTTTPPGKAPPYAKKPPISVNVAPFHTRTCGPPPGPAPVMMSARPSPSTSPAATFTPPGKAELYAKKPPISVNDPPFHTRTCGPPPGPAPVTMSARPSPLTSPAATFTPPGNAELYAKKPPISVKVAPSHTRTCGPPPGPAPVMMSARPSPLTSPAATKTPPENAGSYAKNPAISVSVTPSHTRTCGPPPGPGPVMTSSTPSPLTSPSATRTPPANAGSYARKLRSVPVASSTRTEGGPPGPGAVTSFCADAVAGIARAASSATQIGRIPRSGMRVTYGIRMARVCNAWKSRAECSRKS